MSACYAYYFISLSPSLTSVFWPSRRALHHARHLLSLLSQFPATNPSQADQPQSSTNPPPSTELDISSLQRQIRSRYKVLCASLGIRPSLRANSSPAGENGLDDGMSVDGTTLNGNVNDNRSMEGRSGGAGGGKKIWKVDASRGVWLSEPQGLSF